MRIESLHVYPIKSCRGIDLQEAVVTETGLLHDREWMVARPDGLFLSQRVLPKMAQITALVGDDHLAVNAPGMAELRVPLNRRIDELPIDERVPATVWKTTFATRYEGDEAAGWFSTFLGRDCRLLRSCGERTIPDHHIEGTYNRVGCADGYPMLVTSVATLEYVNTHLPDAVPMNRFRPNVVVGGDELVTGAEDFWRTLRLGDLHVHVVKPCSRCRVPDTDQTTGERLNDVKGALEALRCGYQAGAPDKLGTYFGQYVVHRGPAGSVIRVGDTVEVVEAAQEPNVVLTS